MPAGDRDLAYPSILATRCRLQAPARRVRLGPQAETCASRQSHMRGRPSFAGPIAGLATKCCCVLAASDLHAPR